MKKYILNNIVIAALLIFGNSSCKKFVEINPPVTDLVKSTVFTEEATANAAVVDLYSKMRTGGFSNGSIFSFSFGGALMSDEFINYNTSDFKTDLQQLNDNQITSTNYIVENYWTQLYSQIFRTNAIIDGLANSTGITDSVKMNLEGEAKFVRAFHYFYLVNLWGDVPLTLSVNYESNSNASRDDIEIVYQQIIKDLLDAQNLLPEDYIGYGNERIRVNKGAATALLARVYLYTKDWQNAEIAATSVIDNSLYGLSTDLKTVFRTTSSEAIFQLWNNFYPNDLLSFFVGRRLSNGAMRSEFATSFESQDLRWTNWGGSTTVNGSLYYYAFKYSSSTVPLDYSTVLRLAEQYLIRAEARAMQNNLTGSNSATSDIDIIRSRAGLNPTTAATMDEILLAIEQERAHELFTEWGHRWLDLKRYERLEAVLQPVKSNWQSYKSLLPIPQVQIDRDPAMANEQNPGF